jgi:tetratricopeptide (TPR) repeat protein
VSADGAPPTPRWFLAAAVLFLILIAGLSYSNSLRTEFALDNALVIGQDTRLRAWRWEQTDPLSRITQPQLSLVFTEGYWFPNFPSDLYRPLTTITYAFNWSGPRLYYFNLREMKWKLTGSRPDDLAGGPELGPGGFFDAVAYVLGSSDSPSLLPPRGIKAVSGLLYLIGLGAAFLVARQFVRRWWLALILAVVAVVALPALPWSFTHNGPAPGMAIERHHTYGFHLTNLVLHLVNVSLVLVIVRRLTQRPWLSLLAAAIFAVHPAETESVTNVVGRADELATLWILTGFWCYLRAVATESIADPLLRVFVRIGWLIGLMLAATAGMFSKESGIMIGLLVPLYDFIFRWPGLTGRFWERVGKAGWEFFAKGWVAMIPAAMFFFIVRAGMIEETPTYGQLFIDNPIARVPDELAFVNEERKLGLVGKIGAWSDQITVSGELTAMKVLGRYLGILAYPATLSCDYSFNQIPLYGEPGTPLWENLQCWVSLVVVLGLLTIAWFRRLQNPLFSFGVFFFFGMMLPTANLLFPIGSIMGERFLYLPSIGFCLVAALALRLAGEKLAAALAAPAVWRFRAGLALPLVVLVALGLRTYARNADWDSEFSLWKSAASAAPNSFKVHKGLANGYWNRTNGYSPAIREAGLDEAIARAEVGLAVLNEHPLPRNRQDNTLFCDLGMYYNLKARFLLDPNRQPAPVPAEAAKFYLKAVDVMTRAKEVDSWVNLASRGSKLRRGAKLTDITDVGNPRVHNQLAEAYLGLGMWKEAADAAAYSRHLGPNQSTAYLYLGTAQLQNKEFEKAAVTLLEALLIDGSVSSNQGYWLNLKLAYEALGQKNAVQERVQEGPNGQKETSLALDPNNLQVRSHIQQASTEIVRLLVEAKDTGNAYNFRQMLITNGTAAESALPPVETKPRPTFGDRLGKSLRALLPFLSDDKAKK